MTRSVRQHLDAPLELLNEYPTLRVSHFAQYYERTFRRMRLMLLFVLETCTGSSCSACTSSTSRGC